MEGKRPYDRQRDRLVFPIRDERGHVVGFGGRSLSGEEPKYLNSPETPIFAKNRLLYGLPAARDAIRREDRTILVEGYFDHLALWLSDLKGTVASMGTAFGRAQAEKLRRLAPRAVICYDGDTAGKNATRRAIPTLLAAGIEVSVARMPSGLDPFDLYRESGPGAVGAAIEEAPPFLEWLLGDIAEGESPRERSEKVNALLTTLESIPPRAPVRVRSGLSAAADMPADLLWRRGGAGTAAPEEGTNASERPLSRVPAPAVERRLVSSLVNGKGIPDALFSELDPDLLTDPRLRAIFRVVLDERKNGEPLDFPSAATHLSDEDQRVLFSELACDEEEAGDPEAISNYTSYLTRAFLERQAAAIQQEIVAAQANGDKEEIDRLFRSKTALKQQIADLGRESARRKNC